MIGVTIVATVAAAGIAGYLVASYRWDRRRSEMYAARRREIMRQHPSTHVVAEAEAIVHAAYTSDPSTWPR